MAATYLRLKARYQILFHNLYIYINFLKRVKKTVRSRPKQNKPSVFDFRGANIGSIHSDGMVVGLLRLRPVVVFGVLDRQCCDAVPPHRRSGRHH